MPAMLPPSAHVHPQIAEAAQIAEVAGVVGVADAAAARSGRSHPVAPYGWTGYLVRPGDTISSIALSRHVPVSTLVQRNGLRGGGHSLSVGQRLSVPRTRPATSRRHVSKATKARRAGSSSRGSYVVRPGDTLGGIAARYRVPLTDLLRANRMTSSSVLRPGQRLALPVRHVSKKTLAKRTRNGAVGGTRVTRVRVRAGDTVSGIAARYYVSVTSILKANKLHPGQVLRVGSTLRVVVPASTKKTTAGRGTSKSSGASTGLTGSAAASKAWLNAHPAPSRRHVRGLIAKAAAQHGVDRRLALAIGFQESGWNQRAVSPVNAIGAMQCMPTTGQWMSQILGRKLNLLIAEDNVQCGVGLLRTLARSATDEREVIAAYYQGLGSVRQRGLYEDTKAYVASVLAHKKRM